MWNLRLRNVLKLSHKGMFYSKKGVCFWNPPPAFRPSLTLGHRCFRNFAERQGSYASTATKYLPQSTSDAVPVTKWLIPHLICTVYPGAARLVSRMLSCNQRDAYAFFVYNDQANHCPIFKSELRKPIIFIRKFEPEGHSIIPMPHFIAFSIQFVNSWCTK